MTMGCKKCGHIWQARVVKPQRCPSCFQPRWWEERRRGIVSQPAEVPKIPPRVAVPDEALRAIVSGRIPAEYRVDKTPVGILSGGVGNREAEISTPAGKTAYPVAEGEALFFLDRQPPPVNSFTDDQAVPEAAICTKPPSWDEVNREHVYCRLSSGHKGRCQPGRRVSVDD